MKVQELMEGARDALSVKRVFGEPYESDGVTVIPVASFGGGGGGGEGEGPEAGVGGGRGGGFGMGAKPAGVYVIKGGDVSWQPALDLNKVILRGQIIGLVLLLVMRSVLRTRAKTRRKLKRKH